MAIKCQKLAYAILGAKFGTGYRVCQILHRNSSALESGFTAKILTTLVH